MTQNSNAVGNPINDAENVDDIQLPSGVVETQQPADEMEETEEPPVLKEFPNKMAQFLTAINKVEVCPHSIGKMQTLSVNRPQVV